MKLDVDNLKPGTKLFTLQEGGYEGWYPFVTVIGKGMEHGRLHVRFSNGNESEVFNPNGGMQFKIRNKMKMENK